MELNAIYEGENLEVMSKFDSKSIDLIYEETTYT
jgi:DNA modification methylase